MNKDREYESFGKNIFPLEYLSEDEKKEFGILEKRCCGNTKGSCLSCSKNKDKGNRCDTCSKYSACCKKK